jgi:hypothetical protein
MIFIPIACRPAPRRRELATFHPRRDVDPARRFRPSTGHEDV